MTGADEMNGDARRRVSVPEVLTTLSHEVRVLSDGVSDLQELVGNLLVAGAFAGSSSVYGLQCLDSMSQNLQAIADFLLGVSKQSSPAWKVDVAEASHAVKLAELSGRLNGTANEAAVTSATGEFEDFGWSEAG